MTAGGVREQGVDSRRAAADRAESEQSAETRHRGGEYPAD